MKQYSALSTNDELISALADFMQELYQDAPRYAYTALAGPRFFDAFYACFAEQPGGSGAREDGTADRLLSGSGLLLRHGELLEKYLEDGAFPPVLIADDLADHGTRIGELLFRLEQAVIHDYREKIGRPLTRDELDTLHARLRDAIGIRVFARSRNPLLLEDGYAMKLKCSCRLYADRFHAAADLLRRLADGSGSADAGYALSACRDSCRAPDGSSAEAMLSDRGGWKHVPWRDGGRKMHAYVRLRGDGSGVYLISAVRFYEGSGPLLTSRAFFGDLDIARAYQELDRILASAGGCYEPLRDILRDGNPYVQEARGGLIRAFLSAAGLAEFREAYGLPPGGAFRNGDAARLALMYGERTRAAFRELLGRPELCRELAEAVREGIRAHGQRLPSEAGACGPETAGSVNDGLERFFYDLAMRAEAYAHGYFDAPFLYRTERHAAERGGTIAFREYMDLRGDIPVSGYGRIAAYMALLDGGIVTDGLRYDQDRAVLYSVCEAGDAAQSWLPRKLSVFVPALAAVEKGSPRLNMAPREAVLRFADTRLSYGGSCRDVRDALAELKAHARECLDVLYGAGQMFAGWNFEALTWQDDGEHQAAQRAFLEQARDFLGD